MNWIIALFIAAFITNTLGVVFNSQAVWQKGRGMSLAFVITNSAIVGVIIGVVIAA